MPQRRNPALPLIGLSFRARRRLHRDEASLDHSHHVAIVGAGPAGFYAALELLETPGMDVHVDMFDRLPAPCQLLLAARRLHVLGAQALCLVVGRRRTLLMPGHEHEDRGPRSFPSLGDLPGRRRRPQVRRERGRGGQPRTALTGHAVDLCQREGVCPGERLAHALVSRGLISKEEAQECKTPAGQAGSAEELLSRGEQGSQRSAAELREGERRFLSHGGGVVLQQSDQGIDRLSFSTLPQRPCRRCSDFGAGRAQLRDEVGRRLGSSPRRRRWSRTAWRVRQR